MKVAFLASDMVEQVELTAPWKAVEQAGWEHELISLKGGEIRPPSISTRAIPSRSTGRWATPTRGTMTRSSSQGESRTRT